MKLLRTIFGSLRGLFSNYLVPNEGAAGNPTTSKPVNHRSIHLIGNFDNTTILRNGKEVEMSSLKRVPATKNVGEHFSIQNGETTYIFWNKPNATQARIQSAQRAGHYVLQGKADSIQLGCAGFEVDGDQGNQIYALPYGCDINDTNEVEEINITALPISPDFRGAAEGGTTDNHLRASNARTAERELLVTGPHPVLA